MRIIKKVILALIACFAIVLYKAVFMLHHWNLPEVEIGEGDGSVQVYYISLDNAEDRRKILMPRLENLGLPYERISAIYGKDLSQEEKDKRVNRLIFKITQRREVKDGEIGCYLSHLKAWQTFLKSKASYALILEDDATFNPDELRNMVNLLLQHKDKWDYVNLDPHRDGNGREIQKLSEKHKLIAPRQLVWSCVCYLINRKAVATLIQHDLPMVIPVDHVINRSWELRYKYRIVYPNIIGHDFGDTYIGDRTGVSGSKAIRWLAKLYCQITDFMCNVMANFG